MCVSTKTQCTYAAGVTLLEWDWWCESVCLCVCLRSEPVEVSYKGPPQLCQQTGNWCAFSQFHMAPSALSNQPKAPCFSSRLPKFCTNVTTTIHAISFLTAHPPAGPRVGLSVRLDRRWCSVTMVLRVFLDITCVWMPVYSAYVLALFS